MPMPAGCHRDLPAGAAPCRWDYQRGEPCHIIADLFADFKMFIRFRALASYVWRTIQSHELFAD
jgi:hypothetical protein